MQDLTPSRSAGWLFGPVPDLLFGCGLAYMIVFVGLAVAGPGVTLWLPATLLPLLAVIAGGPHYGATLLRAYERKEDRAKYRSVTVVATLALAVAFLVSLLMNHTYRRRNPTVGTTKKSIAVMPSL